MGWNALWAWVLVCVNMDGMQLTDANVIMSTFSFS